MSCESNVNPKVSAYTLINGVYDFNKNPFTPAAMKAIVHDRPDEQKSWAEHGSRGFSIGPALNHWQCYRVYMQETKSIRVSNTVGFFPPQSSDPLINEETQISLILDDLVSILSKLTRTIPSIMYGSKLNDALRTMQQLMCKDATGKQRYVGINNKEQRVGHVQQQGPCTQSQTFVQFLIRTIIHKKFGDGKF